MNEISSILRIANTTLKTIKVMEIAKRAVIAVAIAVCFVFGLKYWRNR